MQIVSSTIGMESARSFKSQTKQSLSITAVAGQTTKPGLFSSSLGFSDMLPGQNDEKEQAGNTENENLNPANRLEELRHRVNSFTTHRLFGRPMALDSRSLSSQLRLIRQQTIEFLFQTLFSGVRRNTSETSPQNKFPPDAEVIPMPPLNFITVAAQRSFEYSESESTSFTAKGIVKTTDGRQIEFDMNVIMTREFRVVYEETFVQTSQIFTDPLVINLDSFNAELADQTFIFDIDGDGELDLISMLSNRSGYLALDRNNDGIINDGNELFGTKSGNGFKDLAMYDRDQNGWIDEGDEIWSKLRIWVMEADGSSTLYTLACKGVGAIYLGNMATEFSLTDDENQAKGMIRNTGLFLYESGAVGSIQQVDLVKYQA